MKKTLATFLILILVATCTTCDKATYPKEKLEESIKKLCREEYNADVDVTVVGKTIAIYLPVLNLFDPNLSISKEAQEEIQSVLLSASRVTLSTDADIKFYCVIAQDIRIPEIQLVIIKYVEDVKRAFFQNISRSEYFKRTLIEITENPQAKKEQAILSVLKKMKVEKEWQNKVMEDFFRGEPSSLEGIGYWNGRFYVKDVTIEEFLAQQMVSRVKMRFREEKSLNRYSLKSIEGEYKGDKIPAFFLIGFRVDNLLFVTDPAKRLYMEKEIFKGIFEEVSNVVYGYKFRDFDLVRIIEQNYNEKLFVTKEDIFLFKKGELEIGNILEGIN